MSLSVVTGLAVPFHLVTRLHLHSTSQPILHHDCQTGRSTFLRILRHGPSFVVNAGQLIVRWAFNSAIKHGAIETEREPGVAESGSEADETGLLDE